MKSISNLTFIFILIFSCSIQVENSLAEDNIDFISIIKDDSSMYNSIGLRKLSTAELTKLNSLLNIIYESGIEYGFNSNLTNTDKLQNNYSKSTKEPNHTSNKCFITRVESEDNDVLKLENGSIVEISSGYLGYVGYRKTAVLYKTNNNWKIWIEGKKAYKCDLLKLPQYDVSYSVEEVYISEVTGDGTILKMLDGRLFEVDSYYTISTSLWLGLSDALIIDDCRLINLDEGDEIIEIVLLK